jgi:pimeloyl-ACP methyl ester carboxylesterase
MPYVRTRLGRWFYEERGAPAKPGDAAMVLLHGVLFDGRMWRGQVEPLSALGRVIVLDGPGSGRSDAPPRFSLEDNADAMLDVLAELGVNRAVFIGLSWGGMVSMRMAVQHPEKVAALALLDTNADAESPADRVRYRLLIAFARRYGVPPVVTAREAVPKMFSDAFVRDHPEVVESYMRATRGFDRNGIARACLAVLVKRTPFADRLGKIRAPTLVLCGSADRSTPLEKSEAIARGISGARLVVIEGAGHMSAIEQPARINEALVPFVRENLSRTC